MSQARQIARDIEVIAARTEADTMIVQFFNEVRFPEEAAGELLVRFRDFRQKARQQSPRAHKLAKSRFWANPGVRTHTHDIA
ncbi:MAG: hypothetical protein ACRD7E_20570 [Bryobacteraceae bacterium]